MRIDVSPQSIWKRKKCIDDEADNNVEVTEDKHNEIEYEGNRSIEMTADELLTCSIC